MMLFNLSTDPGEQRDVAGENPDVVKRLKAMFDDMNRDVPEFPPVESDYLFKAPAKGRPRELMRLIGGELRYDRIPKPQQHLLLKPSEREK
jgi:hypothetical protein